MHDAPHILLFYWKSSNLLDFHKVYFMYTKIYCFMRFSFGSMVYEYRFDSAFLQKFCFLCYFFFYAKIKYNFIHINKDGHLGKIRSLKMIISLS